MSDALPTTNGTNGANGGRDSSGRFTHGNKGGPGNPFANRVQVYRKAVFEAISEEDVRAVLRKMLEQALAGDNAAQREILDRTLGKPKQSVEVDDPGWRQYRTDFERGRLVASVDHGDNGDADEP